MNVNKANWECIFFVKVALVVGLLLIVITPPMCTPDENAHYMNAYSVSRGDFFVQIEGGQLGRYVKTNVLQFKDHYTGRYNSNFELSYSFGEAYFDSWLPNNDTTESFYASNLTVLSPVGYLISGFGMRLGSQLGKFLEQAVSELPYNLMLYGRLANLAFYIVVTYAALRLTPHFKKAMLILGLMPMSIFLGASLNPDALLISTSMLFVAVVLNLMSHNEEVVGWKDILAVVFCTVVFVGIKQAYAPLLMLLIVIPIRKYGGRKRLYECVGVVIVAAVIAYAPNMIQKALSAPIPDPYVDILAEQAKFIMTHLTDLPQVILKSLAMFSGFYLEGFWGKLGQLDTNFPLPLMILFYVVLFAVTFMEVSSYQVWSQGRWKRILPIVSVLISIVGMFLVMYAQWTPLPGVAEGVGTPYVSGIQGRYFIPLFLPLLLCFSNEMMKTEKCLYVADRCSSILAKGCAMGCGAVTIFLVYARYW